MKIAVRLVVLVLALSWLFRVEGYAQEEVFSLGFQLGNGARALAMGGAYTSVGGDYSASLWNPAALADIKRTEIFGSLSHLMRENTASFGVTAPVQNEASFTRLNDFGMAYAVPTVRGSMVFSFGFNRVKTYDSNFAFEWFNATDDDLVSQAWREIEDGSLNAWTLAGAVDVSPNASLGLSMNFWSGGTEFGSTFREVDVDDIYTFESFTVEDNLNTDITGFNLKGGALFRVGPMLRLGATVSTPIKFKVEEDFSNLEELLLDDQSVEDSLDEGVFEYRIRSPWTFTGGASLSLLNFVFSGDVEYNDWSQVRYTSEPPFEGLSQNEANRLIRQNYRPTTRLRVGAEFGLPLTGVSVRAGYFRDPSIQQDRPSEEDKQFYSAGVGFLVDKQVKLDVTYVHGFWKSFNGELPVPGAISDITNHAEDIKVNKVFVTLAFRL